MTRAAAATLCLLAACARPPAPVAAPVELSVAPAPTGGAPPVTLPATHVHVLRSGVNGREYHIGVALPLSYQADAGADGARYPVLYLLDGGAHLPIFASMFRLTNRGARTGGVILVGIGYSPPGVFPGPVPGQVPFRNIDYTPPLTGAAGARPDSAGARQSGGAPEFHRVLKEEIIPFIERTYRATGDRALHGHSYGGLFASYVLFEDPDLFTRYAIISPAYWWDDRSMFARELSFRARRTSLPKQVYLAVGGLEGAGMLGDMWRMAWALCTGLKSGSYRGLELAAEVVPDEHHGSAAFFGRALKALYPPYEAPGPRPDPCASR